MDRIDCNLPRITPELPPRSKTRFSVTTSAFQVVIANPAPGFWFAVINGFTVFGEQDRWELRVTADGVRLTGF